MLRKQSDQGKKLRSKLEAGKGTFTMPQHKSTEGSQVIWVTTQRSCVETQVSRNLFGNLCGSKVVHRKNSEDSIGFYYDISCKFGTYFIMKFLREFARMSMVMPRIHERI